MRPPHKRRFKTPCLVPALSLLFAACASPAHLEPSAPQAQPKAPAPAERPLYSALRSVEVAPGVLEALPANLRQRLEEEVGKLTSQERAALLDPDDRFLKVRPLLHLAAGGRSLDAYHAMIASSVVSDSLVRLRFPTREFDDLIDVSNSIVTRAATILLRERAADFAPGRELISERLEQVAQAAATLKRRDIEALALEELLLIEEKPERSAALAVVHAEGLELPLARQLLERALAKDTEDRYGWASAAVAAATTVAEYPTPEDAGERVKVARAYLALGQEGLALRTLEGASAEVGRNLALTTTMIRAQLGGTACPLVLRGNAPLCRAAWMRTQRGSALQGLEAAWTSGLGRDAEAVESYLGLSFVVPMRYRLDSAGQEAGPAVFRDYLAEIEQRALATTEQLPYMAGVAAFSAALSTAFDSVTVADPEVRAVIPGKQRRQLLQRATQLMADLGQDFWGQAGALAILALTAQDESVAEQLRSIRADVLPQHRLPYATLALWSALADADLEALRELRGLLAEITHELDASGLERSRWLVLWAEADAHLDPGPKTHGALLTISEKLMDPRVPLALRLRSALSIAGIKARAGDFKAGVSVLEPMVASTSKAAVSSRDEQELLIAAQGYTLILQALLSRGEIRRGYAQKLESLLLDVAKKSAAPPTLQVWLALWRRQLAVELEREQCRGNAACERRAQSSQRLSRQQLEARLGARTLQLLKHGVVPIGGVELDIRYQNNGRIRPFIHLDPRFPLMHVPPLDLALR